MRRIILRGIVVLIVGFLVVLNAMLAGMYFSTSREVTALKAIVEKKRVNNNIVRFAQLFVERVLESEREVDYEARVQLEIAVHDLHDEEILPRWNAFVQSETQDEAQTAVVELLKILLERVAG